MSSGPPGNQDRHRLFHAIVLMGTSAALGCSDNAEAKVDPAQPDSGGTGGSTAIVDAGPDQDSDPLIEFTPRRPEAPPCPASQLDCPHFVWQCEYVLPDENCNCDASRPASAEDCLAGESYVCREAADWGDPLIRIPFECVCAPQESDCEVACKQAFGSTNIEQDTCRESPGSPSEVLCRCAIAFPR